MIKALHIRSSFDPGGTETLLLNLFNHKQIEVQIHLALIKDGFYISRLNSQHNKSYKVFRKRFFDIKVVQALLEILKKNNIKVVHSHQEIELFYAVILKLLNPGIKIFHSIHLYNPDYNADYLFEKSMTVFVKKVITVSHSIREKLVKKGYSERKLDVIYNAVQVKKTDESINESFRKKIKYTGQDYIILMTGNFRPEKDHLTLIKAFNLLRTKHGNLKLVFIGKESDETFECKKLTKVDDLNERVFYLGSIEDAGMLSKLCNLFVFSSKSETFGIAVIEALLLRTPVLASDIDVMIELSGNGKYFNLFKTGDHKDLANKIEWFLDKSNSKNTETKTEDALCYALSEFSYEKYTERLTALYNE